MRSQTGKKRCVFVAWFVAVSIVLAVAIWSLSVNAQRQFCQIYPKAERATKASIWINRGGQDIENVFLEGHDMETLVDYLEQFSFHLNTQNLFGRKSNLELRKTTYHILFFADGNWDAVSIVLTDLGNLAVDGKIYETQPAVFVELPIADR